MKRKDDQSDLLAISTEDGRITLFSLPASSSQDKGLQENYEKAVPLCTAIAQLCGQASDRKIRIKDFEIFDFDTASDQSNGMLIVAARSNGAIEIWTVGSTEIDDHVALEKASGRTNSTAHTSNGTKALSEEHGDNSIQRGQCIGSYETGNRVTCLKAFVLLDAASSQDGLPTARTEETDDAARAEDGEEEFGGIDSEDDSAEPA